MSAKRIPGLADHLAWFNQSPIYGTAERPRRTSPRIELFGKIEELPQSPPNRAKSRCRRAINSG